jgi:hypothetical protein
VNSTDYLRSYTAPRALLIGVLFMVATSFRVPAVALALAVHVLDRCADRLLGWIAQVPPAPIRVVTTARRWSS